MALNHAKYRDLYNDLTSKGYAANDAQRYAMDYAQGGVSPTAGLIPAMSIPKTNPGATPKAAAGGKKWNLFGKNLKSKFGDWSGKVMSPEFDYDLKSGVKGWGKNLGTALNWINLAGQGINAAQGLSNLSEIQGATDDITADIITTAANSPMITYDLSPDQLDLLRQLQRGTYDSDVGVDDLNLLGMLGDIGMGVLTGAPGGLPGMFIGGLGAAANTGISQLQNAASQNNAELEALYSAILNSRQNYNDIIRQRAYANI